MKYNDNYYGYPKLNGSGLGNLLWIWGKCFLWCKDHGIPIIAPNWVQIHPLRIFTLNPDLRLYWRYFTNKDYIKGWQKYYLLYKSKIIPIEMMNSKQSEFPREKSIVFIFSNMGDFTPLIGRQKEIYSELLRITQPHFSTMKRSKPPFVAIHIRRGDFCKGTKEELQAGKTNLQIPLNWYIAALSALRETIGYPFQAIVFSDGTDKDIEPLLKEPNIKRSCEKNALRDLLFMSSAAALIASRSSFSLWASYLGQMPTLYYRGARPWNESIINSESAFELEPEWEENAPFPIKFSSSVASRISSAQGESHRCQ